MHIPEPRRHLVRYYGWYSNVSRGKRKRREHELAAGSSVSTAGSRNTDEDRSRDARTLRRRWVAMIKMVYEVDPLVCPRCQGDLPAGRQGCGSSG